MPDRAPKNLEVCMADKRSVIRRNGCGGATVVATAVFVAAEYGRGRASSSALQAGACCYPSITIRVLPAPCCWMRLKNLAALEVVRRMQPWEAGRPMRP